VTADLHALVGAYALDALDDLERAAFDRHLRDCPTCRSDADELQETAAHLADDAWSVPPPALRDTAQLAPSSSEPAPARTGRNHRSHRGRLIAAAAAVVAAVAAGTTVYAVQDRRVRQEQSIAEAAQHSEAWVQAILASPDLTLREQPLVSGGRVTVAVSRLRNAGAIILAAEDAPPAGRIYQLWTIRSETPTPVKALVEGESVTVQIVEGLPGASGVGVTIEPAPGSTTPTTPLDALVELT
jgi:hypothetical protein